MFCSLSANKGHFVTCAGVGTNSATPVVLTMLAVYRHANACSGMMKPSSHPLQHDPAKQHPRSGHGTHLTACQPPLRGTRSRSVRSWHSSRGSSQGVSAWETTPASRHPAVLTRILLTPWRTSTCYHGSSDLFQWSTRATTMTTSTEKGTVIDSSKETAHTVFHST